METTNYNKTAILMLKEDIKERAELQKFYKNQRKTEHIVGERKMPAWKAAVEHTYNREKLRRMYLAYAILRGKEDLEETDRNYSDIGGYHGIVEEYIKKSAEAEVEKVE